MPEPMCICIEDLDAPPKAARYVRCTAVPGRQPGLRVDGQGMILWKDDRGAACELWVSADDQLILYRPTGGGAVTVRRAGRSLAAPEGKPVVLLDRDEFEVGGRRLRIHVHGIAPAIAAPEPLPVSAGGGAAAVARAAAAAAVVGTVLAGGTGCADVFAKKKPTPPIQVREQPPVPMPPKPPPIQVRETPPDIAPMPAPPPEPKK